MRLLTMLAAAGLTFAAGGAQAATLEIRDAVARVTVVPEARSDITVEFVSRNARLPIDVHVRGDRTVVDGGLDRKIRSCRSTNGRSSVEVSGVGQVAWDEMPQILVRAPKDVVVEAGGGVFGAVGRSDNLTLSSAGCGDWTVANVAGRLVVNLAGSGDVMTGSAGQARLRLAGSGDIDARDVKGALEVDLAGSGDVDVATVHGTLDVKIAGSGDVEIDGGRAGAVNVAVAGSGDVMFGGTAESLKARIAGSGDVHVKAVSGAIDKAVLGSGSVTVG